MNPVKKVIAPAVTGVLSLVLDAAFTVQCRLDFNNMAKAQVDQDVEHDFDARWNINLAQIGELDEEMMSFVMQRYQKAYVRAAKSSKALFLAHGNGVSYIHGILHSVDQSTRYDDLLSMIKDFISGKKRAFNPARELGDIMINFAKDAFDDVANQKNQKLASAYVLVLMEAFPMLKSEYLEHELASHFRPVLEYAMTSDLIEPLLKEQLRKSYAIFQGEQPEMAPALRLIPKG